MMIRLLAILGLFCLLGCEAPIKSKRFTSDMKADMAGESSGRSEFPEPDMMLRLSGQQTAIENGIKDRSYKFEMYASEKGSSKPILIGSDAWPDNVETAYTIWRDEDERIVCAGSSPISESGDWSINYLHFFDSSGKTFAFGRYSRFYNSECAPDEAVEEIVEYYDRHFNRVDRKYVLTTPEGEALERSECVFNYDYPTDVFATTDMYLNARNLR